MILILLPAILRFHIQSNYSETEYENKLFFLPQFSTMSKIVFPTVFDKIM